MEHSTRHLKRHSEIQVLLKEISQYITSMALDPLLRKLSEKVREVLEVDIADLRVRTDDKWQIIGVAGIAPQRLQSHGVDTPLGRSKWIVENRKPLVISDIEQKKDSFTGSVLSNLGIRGYAGVPVFSRHGEVLGVLRAMSYRPRTFTPDEVGILQQIACDTGIALENARLLEQSKQQSVELARAHKLQADFTAMVIHDLRSPLTAMIGSAEMLAGGLLGPVNDEQKEWLLKLAESGRKIADLVSDFLDLSKIEAGRIDLSKHHTDLRELIQNSIQNYMPLARAKNIRLVNGVPVTFPTIRADSRRLDQVLSNLLSNALKFTSDGGIIEVGADRAKDATHVRIWVKDNGVGIPPEEMNTLFEKYRQLTSGKLSESKGTGLGLAICKAIVEAHGGKIWVESDIGIGSTFYVSLPQDD